MIVPFWTPPIETVLHNTGPLPEEFEHQTLYSNDDIIIYLDHNTNDIIPQSMSLLVVIESIMWHL